MRIPLRALVTMIGVSTLALPAPTLAGEPTTYQTSNALDFGTHAPVAGAASLYRTSQSVRAALSTSGLEANGAYTVWWVVFNNPAACATNCGASDLSNPEVRASVLYAAGFLSDGSGTANVTAQLAAGTPPNGANVVRGNGLDPGNGFGAEIHLVVRAHGAPIPGQVAKQISTFDASCTTCSNKQAVPFAPVQ
jgi:hypothetical protein